MKRHRDNNDDNSDDSFSSPDDKRRRFESPLDDDDDDDEGHVISFCEGEVQSIPENCGLEPIAIEIPFSSSSSSSSVDEDIADSDINVLDDETIKEVQNTRPPPHSIEG